jgi:alkylhydroperoxidase family enzyme
MNHMNPIKNRMNRAEVFTDADQLSLGSEEVSEFLRALAKSLATMRTSAGSECSLAHGRLTAEQCRQIALATPEINRSSTVRAAALTTDASRKARQFAAEDPKGDALLRFTQVVVFRRGKIKKEYLRIPRQAGFSESEIIEIVANIALNIFNSYLNVIPKTEMAFPHSRTNSRPDSLQRHERWHGGSRWRSFFIRLTAGTPTVNN